VELRCRVALATALETVWWDCDQWSKYDLSGGGTQFPLVPPYFDH